MRICPSATTDSVGREVQVSARTRPPEEDAVRVPLKFNLPQPPGHRESPMMMTSGQEKAMSSGRQSWS